MQKRRIWIIILILAILIGFQIWRTWFRTQPLTDLLSPEDWQSVQAEHQPADGAESPLVDVHPEGLAAKLASVTVKAGEKTNVLSIPCITFWLHTGSGETFELVVGQNGSVTYADSSDLSGTRTYWKATEKGLYETLLPLLSEAE